MLKAILFDFNGVVINDEPIHQELIEELLLGENLPPGTSKFRELCLGRNDRACIRDVLAARGRSISEDYLSKLIEKKSRTYLKKLEELEQLPIYPNLENFLQIIQAKGFKIGLVTGALRNEVKYILDRAQLSKYFPIIVTGDEIRESKPAPEGYLLAIDKLNRSDSYLQLQPRECLAIEDTPAGIEAAKRAGIKVVGIAHTYPFHFMQRLANWAIDYFPDLELERVEGTMNQI
jgi:HAD superfamily hydrolase (TIGR01509 family)